MLNHSRSLTLPMCRLALIASGLVFALAGSATAATDSKPYDDKLLRLAEILGAIHYLRELCSADEGLRWRERMSELLNAEGSSALRRARLTRRFNRGYRSYSRTYVSCTPSAQTAIARFLTEGTDISEGLAKNVP
jgi:uncharacterized protein (TIGR02301 family)